MLSPAAREVLRHVGLRLSAGFTADEVAAVLDRERPMFRHHEVPPEVKRHPLAGRAATVPELRRGPLARLGK
jgi:hypothetical protein